MPSTNKPRDQSESNGFSQLLNPPAGDVPIKNRLPSLSNAICANPGDASAGYSDVDHVSFLIS